MPNPVIPLKVQDMLDYFDGPILLSCRDEEQKLYLAYFGACSPKTETFLVTEISEERLTRINEGKEDVRLVFELPDNPVFWLITVNGSEGVVIANLADFDKAPEYLLPPPEYFLTYE